MPKTLLGNSGVFAVSAYDRKVVTAVDSWRALHCRFGAACHVGFAIWPMLGITEWRGLQGEDLPVAEDSLLVDRKPS